MSCLSSVYTKNAIATPENNMLNSMAYSERVKPQQSIHHTGQMPHEMKRTGWWKL